MKMKKGKNLTKGLGVQPREKTHPANPTLSPPHTSKMQSVDVYKQVHHRLKYYLYKDSTYIYKGKGDSKTTTTTTD